MIGVTSFSPDGYAMYGKHFLKHAHNFPGKIILYTEAPVRPNIENVEERNLFAIPGITQFLSNIKDVPQAKGFVDGKYTYNFDLWKFCRKMFCQFDAFKEGGKVIWLDADLEIFKPLPQGFLEDLFAGEPLFLLGREDLYTETGIVGFDTEHEKFPEFLKRYEDTLRRGLVFKFPGWHDCYCFDYARKGAGNNLTSNWKWGDGLEVLTPTVLGQYMIHRKGKRKDEILNS